MKLETIKLIDKMLREAVTKAQHEYESKKKEAEAALMASFEMRNKEDANRQWIYSNEMEKEQGKAKSGMMKCGRRRGILQTATGGKK